LNSDQDTAVKAAVFLVVNYIGCAHPAKSGG